MKTVQMLQMEAAQRNKEEVFLTDSEPSQEQWGLDLKQPRTEFLQFLENMSTGLVHFFIHYYYLP